MVCAKSRGRQTIILSQIHDGSAIELENIIIEKITSENTMLSAYSIILNVTMFAVANKVNR